MLGALADAVVVFVVIFGTKINKYQIYIYISKKLIGKQTRPTFRKPEGKKSTENEQKIQKREINERNQR